MLTKKRAILLAIMAIILIAAPILALSASVQGDEDDEMCVISLWQIDSFEGGRGSRAQYLQNMADKCFEDTKVYVTVTSLSAQAARANMQAGIVPDIISYGAGFYGIENLVNAADFTYKCWCRGAYVLLSLDANTNFDDVGANNTIVNAGKDNMTAACALFEGLAQADVRPPTSAYVSLLAGDYKYLLGTQRDIYRLETRGVTYAAKVITSFNDLYQNISVLCEGEKYYYSCEFVDYLTESCSNVAELGLVSDKTAHTGVMAEVQNATFECTLNGFIGNDYYNLLQAAVEKGDIKSLKNLLK